HVSVLRLVRTRAGSDVDDGSRIAERRKDPFLDAWVGSPHARIPVAVQVVIGQGIGQRNQPDPRSKIAAIASPATSSAPARRVCVNANAANHSGHTGKPLGGRS